MSIIILIVIIVTWKFNIVNLFKLGLKEFAVTIDSLTIVDKETRTEIEMC